MAIRFNVNGVAPAELRDFYRKLGRNGYTVELTNSKVVRISGHDLLSPVGGPYTSGDPHSVQHLKTRMRHRGAKL